ncbi:MAG: hypothetical protein K6D59_00715 [Bacteroidales bacterium]|nr:hypothetical protein [Bacteroidales bacterium]
MKITKILKFFLLCLSLLAILAITFPDKGVTVAGKGLRFATLHKVLTGHHGEKTTEVVTSKMDAEELRNIEDSIEYYRMLLASETSHLWLPKSDYGYFDRFFAAATEAVEKGTMVRVLHYGDSQIEMDRMSCCLRDTLQRLIGGGGIGMVPLNQTVNSMSFVQKYVGAAACVSTWGGKQQTVTKGSYGPMLRSWHVDGKATATLRCVTSKSASQRVKRFSNVKVLYNNHGRKLSVVVSRLDEGTSSRKEASREGVGMLEWTMDSATAVRMEISGDADIFGILVDDGNGVAVDNIAMRGSSGTKFTAVDSVELANCYKMINVGMVVLQFGGNAVPGLNGERTVDMYCDKIKRQIEYLKRVSPKVTILFVGPSDMSTKVGGEYSSYPWLRLLDEKLRTTVLSQGVAYWSMFDAMGGDGSMVDWVAAGKAGKDYVHFTPKGATIMGGELGRIMGICYRHHLLMSHKNEIKR